LTGFTGIFLSDAEEESFNDTKYEGRIVFDIVFKDPL